MNFIPINSCNSLLFGSIYNKPVSTSPSEGYDVCLHKDGVRGLESIQQNTYDLCVLDVMMPNMDGFTLSKKIQQHNENLPFIFLTARTLKTDRLNGFAIGAEDYITKPFDEEELLCRIKVCLRRQSVVSLLSVR